MVEMSSLLKKSSFFEAQIDLVNACKTHKTPVYLIKGIMDERKLFETKKIKLDVLKSEKIIGLN